MIGTTLGHYRIVDKIGEGGMGEVYRAHDERLDREVAVKVLPTSVAQDPERIARFEREAKAVAKLAHPNILEIWDYGTDEGVTYSVTELLEGETLRERLEGGGLGWRKAAEIGASIADGLAAAHGAGIIHRDLKPDNVFLTSDGRVKILDFGLARDVTAASPEETHSPTVSRYTDPGAVMGTAGYMSPEQVRGQSADARSDIFSLSCVLYEMVSGQRAFARDTAVETMNAVLKEEPADITASGEALPPELAGTVRRCLEKKPQSRFQSASDLAYNLRTISSTSAATAGRPASLVSERRRRALWLAAAVVAAAAVGLVLYLGRGGGEAIGIGASGRPAVAVMPFDCTAASEELGWLRQGVPDMLVTGLAQTQGLDVVSSERLLEILDRLVPESAETIAPRQVLEVARRAGAGAVVVGSVFGTGPELRIDIRVQDPSDGRLLFARDVRGDEVFGLVDELTEQIRDQLGITTGEPSRGIAELTTGSLEAYRLFVEGRNADRNMRWPDALELYRRAIELDPTFTMAYFELVDGALTPDSALRDEYKRKTLEGLDRLSGRERLEVESCVASWEGDDERALTLQEELVTRYPDDPAAYIRLANLYSLVLGDTEKALHAFERGVEAVPTDGPLRNLFAYELMHLGRFDEALHQLEAYAQFAPREPNPYDALGDAYLMMGRPEEAIGHYTDAVEVDRTWGADGRAWAYAVLGRYDDALVEWVAFEELVADDDYRRILIEMLKGLYLVRAGRYREAEMAVREVHQLSGDPRVRWAEPRAWVVSSIIALERGRLSEAVHGAGLALELGFRDGTLEHRWRLFAHLVAGIGEARSGRLAAAEDHVDAVAAGADPHDVFHTWTYRSLEGEIALASGDLDRAEAAFAAGLPDGKMTFGFRFPSVFFIHNSPSRDWRARICRARGDAAGAIAEYRRLLTPSAEQKFVGVLEPRYVLELARLLDQEGALEAAREEYQRFLELWKNADPDLPELAEARTRLARLDAGSR
jgi:tetratricopeptide (TPR) repeat protein